MRSTWPRKWPFWSNTLADAALAGGTDRLLRAIGAICSGQAGTERRSRDKPLKAAKRTGAILEPRVGITLENAGAGRRVSGTPKLLTPPLPYSPARGLGLPPH